MARSLRSTPRERVTRSNASWPEQTLRLGDLSTPPTINRYISEEPGVVRVKKTHLMYLAALTFGCMTAVFLIGLYAGRDQGVRAALAEYGGEVARIPVADPATTALSGAAVTTADAAKPSPTSEASTQPVAAPQVAEMDFRPEAKVRAGEPDAAATGATTGAAAAEPVTLGKLDTKRDATKPADALTTTGGNWFIQAGAARNEQEAAAYVKKFKSVGITSRVEKAEVKGNKYFRIIVGPYTDKTAADKDVKKVANSKVLKSDPFVRLIK